MKVNFNKINESTRLGLMTKAEILHYMRAVIEYLYTHNKNYTKEQYYRIEDLKNFIANINE